MKRVVVTGLGMVAPCGNNVRDAWEAALAGRSGLATISRFDASGLPVRIAGEVKNFDIGDLIEHKEARRTTRVVQYAVKAAHEALEDAGLTAGNFLPDRTGVSIGVGMGALDEIENNTLILRDQGPRRVSPFFMPYAIANMAAGVVSRLMNLRGPNICTTTACASGTHGVGEAWLYIRNGMADVMIAGGSESAISPLSVAAFASMKALSAQNDNAAAASRPFDRNRDGFVMGEGAGLLVLEDLEHARRRGAQVYAELVGYGMSGDAYHITAPAPEGEGAQRCMRMALESAGIDLAEVDHINAHGTSTPVGDKYETAAIMRVFGDHARDISICSTKGVTGHCLGAAGGIEAVYLALAIRHALVPPTANLVEDDPDCPLDYTKGSPRERPVRCAVSNSFGFGGTNGSIVMRAFSG